jgi:hypothetical protein
MALLKFLKNLGWANYKVVRDAADVVQMMPCRAIERPWDVLCDFQITGVCRLRQRAHHQVDYPVAV